MASLDITVPVVQSSSGARQVAVHKELRSDDLSDCFQNINAYSTLRGAYTVADADGADLTLDASAAGFFDIVVDGGDVNSAVIVNGRPGQTVVFSVKQGAGNGAVSWPVAKYAGGAAPTTSTADGYTDAVTYIFDGTDWQELARSVANH